MDRKLLPFALQDVPRYTSYPTAVQFQDAFPRDLADHVQYPQVLAIGWLVVG
jgi:hypothetical protein